MALIFNKGELDTLLSPASRGAATVDHLDAECRSFIDRATFVCLATSGARGEQHLAPLGGAPGFTEVLDHRTLLLPEWPAPESRDRLRDLLENAHVGLLYLVPGEDRALEVSGSACLSNDARFLEHFKCDDGAPEVVILVEVISAAFVGTGAIAKSALWSSPVPTA